MTDSDRLILVNFQIFKTEKSEKSDFVQKPHTFTPTNYFLFLCSEFGTGIHCWFLAPTIMAMWAMRLADGQGHRMDRYTWTGQYEAPKLQVDQIVMGEDSDEEEKRARKKEVRIGRGKSLPRQTFLHYFVEDLKKLDNKARSPRNLLDAFVYELMGDDQTKLTGYYGADAFFVSLMNQKQTIKYFSGIIPDLEESLHLSPCTLCLSQPIVKTLSQRQAIMNITWDPEVENQTLQSLVEAFLGEGIAEEEDCPKPDCTGTKTRKNTYLMGMERNGFIIKLVRERWDVRKKRMMEIKNSIKLGKNEECFIRHENPVDEDVPVVRYVLVGACRHTGNNATPTSLRSGRKKQTKPTGHWYTYLKYGQYWYEFNDGHYIEEHLPDIDIGRSELFLFMNSDLFPK